MCGVTDFLSSYKVTYRLHDRCCTIHWKWKNEAHPRFIQVSINGVWARGKNRYRKNNKKKGFFHILRWTRRNWNLRFFRSETWKISLLYAPQTLSECMSVRRSVCLLVRLSLAARKRCFLSLLWNWHYLRNPRQSPKFAKSVVHELAIDEMVIGNVQDYWWHCWQL